MSCSLPLSGPNPFPEIVTGAVLPPDFSREGRVYVLSWLAAIVIPVLLVSSWLQLIGDQGTAPSFVFLITQLPDKMQKSRAHEIINEIRRFIHVAIGERNLFRANRSGTASTSGRSESPDSPIPALPIRPLTGIRSRSVNLPLATDPLDFEGSVAFRHISLKLRAFAR